MEHFNKLTPEQAERLALLAEECGEVIQVIGKILRHGYDSCSPFDLAKTTNEDLLTKEIGDVMLAIELLCEAGDVHADSVRQRAAEKRQKVGRWLHHAQVKTS